MQEEEEFVCVDGKSSNGVCVLKLLSSRAVKIHTCHRTHLDCLWQSIHIDGDVVHAKGRHTEEMDMKLYIMDVYQSFYHPNQKYISVIDKNTFDEGGSFVHFTEDPLKTLNEFHEWFKNAPAGYLCCYEGAEVGRMLSCPLEDLLWSESRLLFFDVRHFIDLFSLGGRAQSGGFRHNLTRLEHFPDTDAHAVDFTRESTFFYDQSLSRGGEGSLLREQFLENAQVVYDILTSKNLLDLQKEVSILSGIGWADFQGVSGLQKYVESVISVRAPEYHQQKTLCNKRRTSSCVDTTYRGGLILSAVKGLHCSSSKKVVMTDFQSLYPSIFNLHLVNHGLHALMKHCLSEKVRLKKEGRITEATALKFSANGTYGNLGNPHSIVYESETAAEICRMGREALTTVMNEAQNNSYTTPFGHTDSIFMVMPREDDGVAFCDALNDSVNNGLILEHEGDADKMFIFSNSTYCYVPMDAPHPIEFDEIPPLERKNFMYKNAMSGLFSKGSPPMFDFMTDRVFLVWLFYDVPSMCDLEKYLTEEGVLDLPWNQLQKCLSLLVEKLAIMWEFLKENNAYYDLRWWTCYKKLNQPQTKRGNFMERREKRYELVLPSESQEGLLWDPMEEYIPRLYEIFGNACLLISSTTSLRDITRILHQGGETTTNKQ